MNKLKLQKLRETFFPKKNFGLRMLLLLLGITGMGFSMSLLLKVRFGGDPYTVLMNAVAERTGFPIGNTCALFNMATFLAVLPAGIGYFGFGTLANMFLFGYSLQFFNWAMAGILPESMFRTMPVRVTAFIPAFVLFILSTSLYMVVRLGTSPYDAVPILVARRIKKIPFRLVRMAFDFLMVLIGFLMGGKVGIFTLTMPLFLGPVISLMGNRINARWHLSD